MNNFSIREATAGDKQAVLDCRKNVLDGFDYLPVFYDYFMAAEHIKAFVLLHGEKIVSKLQINYEYFLFIWQINSYYNFT